MAQDRTRLIATGARRTAVPHPNVLQPIADSLRSTLDRHGDGQDRRSGITRRVFEKAVRYGRSERR
jgi:hypothetical protein